MVKGRFTPVAHGDKKACIYKAVLCPQKPLKTLMPKIHTAQAIADAVGGRLIGNGSLEVSRLAHPADIHGPSDLVLAMDPKLMPLLEGKRLSAIIISEKGESKAPAAATRIVVNRPRLALAKLTSLFAEPVTVTAGVHATAIIEPGAVIGKNVAIGPYTYVGSDAVIGDNSILHPQVYVGPGAKIGRDTLLHPGVKIGAKVEIGNRVIIHFNASIGADGFSFVTPQIGSVESAKATGAVGATNEEFVRIASLGAVVIGDDVEIGANSSVDSGTIVPTRIGSGTKIDNQVQIGHNVIIGESCLICGRTGIAGSAVVGDRVVLGGAVGVGDHVTIGDDAVVMGMSGVASNIAPREVVGGLPAMPRDRAMENLLNVGRLKHYFAKIEALTERLNALEQKTKSD
jgi:UDP-3-O-[3-hydroxymyristoyl] glucosamine N-acyltransferase